MSAELGLQKWHKVIEEGSAPDALAAIIREDAVFHSPVVHTPQEGRQIVVAYLAAAGQTLGNDSFQYVRELVDGDNAMLEFTTEMDGIHVNGIDLSRDTLYAIWGDSRAGFQASWFAKVALTSFK